MSSNKENKESKLLPDHVAIIPDGNRRWSEERNLSGYEGHRKGYEKLKRSIEWFFSRGVKIISVFVFSSENWNRGKEEIGYLMKLISEAIEREKERALEKGYKVLISGRYNELPGDLPEACDNIMAETKAGTAGTLNLCLNYGGRFEIIDAFKKMIKNGIEGDQIHEGMIKKYLYNGDLPDPDIIVRTSGEQRLSGFLLWQSIYSEFIFLKKYWPDFETSDIDFILDDYSKRKRNFGGDSK